MFNEMHQFLMLLVKIKEYRIDFHVFIFILHQKMAIHGH